MALIKENENIAAEQLMTDMLADQTAQSTKSFAHIGRLAVQKVALLRAKNQL
ncbi:MAG: hypothetical protein AAFY91_18765 [Bacteroidota bacterium]